jgi:addiction module HigA family antidote
MPELFVPKGGPPTLPGEMLVEEFLKPLGVSQTAFAKQIGITQARLSEIIHGKRAVTPDTAMRFERALGMSAQFWLNLQTVRDLYQAQRSPAAKTIARIKRLPQMARAS